MSSQEVGRGKDQEEEEVHEEDSNVQSVKRFNRSKVGSLPSREKVGHRHPEVDIVGYTYTHTDIHIYIYIPICICIYIYTYRYVYIYTYLYVCIYAYNSGTTTREIATWAPS